MSIFSKNGLNDFNRILVIYGDHLPKWNCVVGMFMKVTLLALGAQMRNVAIVQTGSIGRTDFILVRYSTANTGAAEWQTTSRHVDTVKKVNLYEQACTTSLQRFLIMWYEA
jgi:hypothetical protein